MNDEVIVVDRVALTRWDAARSGKKMNAHEISKILEEMAVLLELSGANPFKSRAYRNGARTLKGLTEDVGAIIERDELTTIKGIGKGLTQIITELATTAESTGYNELRESIPDGLIEMISLPGLGAKRVKAIHDALAITTVGELEYACRENRLSALGGFGEKSQARVLESIDFRRRFQDRFLRHHAGMIADVLIAAVRNMPGVHQVDVAGSLRRGCETIKNINVVATSGDMERPAVIKAFAALPGIETVAIKGNRYVSVRLESGFIVNLCVVSDEECPAMLMYSTGSVEHHTEMRARARNRGLKLNEYGLFRGDERIPSSDEADVFAELGLPWIDPALRENLGEFDAAESGNLPTLIERKDIRGLLHVHTTRSDGVNTVEELAHAAIARGFEYLGISDHSRTAIYAGGLTIDDLKAQWDEIDEVNATLDGFVVLKGIESDILADGGLDYPDDLLDGFDFIIASIHSGLRMEAEQATERVLRAIRHPAVSILGHPTGRLLLAREGYPVDLDRVISEASELGVAIELNASPHRLDVDWTWCRTARARGVPISINPDAHAIAGFADVDIGVSVGRKGWLEPADVINTLPVSDFLNAINRKT
jgi:DNA polymerase (family X)